MREQSKVERRLQENHELYGAIRGNEFKVPQVFAPVVRAAAPLGAASVINVVALAALAVQRGEGGPVWWHCAMITGVALAGLLAVTLTRGNHVEAGKRRSQVSAQPGAPRAGPRKARPDPGHERGG